MEFFNRFLVLFSIVTFIFTISVEATDPFLSEDEVKEVFGPVSGESKESTGPVSSLDIDKSLEEAKGAFGPISSSILEEAKEAIGPITPSTLDETLDDAKEALGPISPSSIDETFDDAKEAFGPSSSEVLDKAKDKFESWISQNKEDASSSSEAQKEDEANESHLLDKAKEKFDSAMSFITQNKHSSLLEEAEKEFGPIASIYIDATQPPNLDDAEAPISSKEEESIDDEAQKEIGPVSSFVLEEASSREPVVSPSTLEEEVSQTKEEISSEVGPSPSFDEDAPSPSPTSPSTFDKALDAAKEKFGSISSLFSQNKASVESTYFDHDVALAIESLINQGKSKSQLAIEEAKKQLSDGSDNMDKQKCVKNCMENYASCIRHLDKAMEDLKGRNSEFLTNDVSAVDGEISACQSCFLENQSPLKDLEEAIVKAARECLNVLDHSA